MLMLVLLAVSGSLLARHQQSKSYKVVGTVLEIGPASLTIREIGGKRLELTTLEDFSTKLAVGMHVTALYFRQGDLSILQKIENGEETSPSPTAPVGASRSSATPSSESAETVPVSVDQLKAIKKIILLPSSNVPDSGPVFDSIAKYVKTKFGWYVAPKELAAELRRRYRKSEAESLLAATNPQTGEIDMDKYLGGEEGFIVNLASETRVDAVLEVEIERVEANVSRKVASWDGVKEPIAGKASTVLAKLAFFPRRGQVPASTVVLKLWDAQGNLLWRNRRGLAVLEVLTGVSGKVRQRPLSEYLEDKARFDEWLDVVFGPLLSQVAPDRRASTPSK